MKLFRRRAPRRIDTSLLEDPREGEAPFAVQYEHVRTAQGRTAHLMHPDVTGAVLCGWPAPQWHDAPASLPVCHLCLLAAGAGDRKAAAS